MTPGQDTHIKNIFTMSKREALSFGKKKYYALDSFSMKDSTAR